MDHRRHTGVARGRGRAPSQSIAATIVIGVVLAASVAASCSTGSDGASTGPSATTGSDPAAGSSSSPGSTTTSRPDPYSACSFVDREAAELAYVAGLPFDDRTVSAEPPVPVDAAEAVAAASAVVDGTCELAIFEGGGLTTAAVEVARARSDASIVVVDLLGEHVDAALPSNLVVIDVRLDQVAFLAGFVAAGMAPRGTVTVGNGSSDAEDPAIPDGLEPLADAFASGVRYRVGVSGLPTTIGEGGSVRLVLDPAELTDPESTLARARATGTLVVWPAGDLCAAVASTCDLALTGLVADLGPALAELADRAVGGAFIGGRRIAVDLASGQARLAPFHDLEPRLGPALPLEAAALAVYIIDGEVRVAPRDLPASAGRASDGRG